MTSIQVGERRLVRKAVGSWLPAEIIQTRFNEYENHDEYYVHYEGFDRRLDEWVPRYRISEVTDEPLLESKDEAETSGTSDQKVLRKSTRKQKKESERCDLNLIQKNDSEMDPTLVALEKEREELTKVKYIDKIQIGIYEVDTWYFSPYPGEYGKEPKLWICEFCLKYMRKEKSYRYHMGECTWKHPPGRQIYQQGSLSIWEIDGAQHKTYCQLLCLLGKLFLDHKSLFFDTEPFFFYVLCQNVDHGKQLMAYFSKEKQSPEGYNLACILTLPQHQRHGYGRLLIALSYELSKREGKCGSPEKPLSDLGSLGYKTYWSCTLLQCLKGYRGSLSIAQLSEMTSITKEDVIYTLKTLGLLKYYCGWHVVCITPAQIEHILSTMKPPRWHLNPAKLKWPAPATASSSSKK